MRIAIALVLSAWLLLALSGWLLLAGIADAQGIGGTTAPSISGSGQTNITSAPTAPASTTLFKLQGLAGSITPTTTGTVMITVSGYIQGISGGTAATVGIAYQIFTGTGTAPTNGATVTSPCGTTSCAAAGVVAKHMNGATITAADLFRPFSISAVVTGLTAGTPVWIDLAAESLGTASDQGFAQVSISAIELP